MKEALVRTCTHLFQRLDAMPLAERVEAINEIREALREHSPFKSEPVDCVRWVPSSQVVANDYNPNSVAPKEMELLAHSIQEDGYTQPIVSWVNEAKQGGVDLIDGFHRTYEVIDGFHRHRVGKESAPIQERIKGYLPLVVVNDSRTNLGDRMASTIRHNRARGKHKVESMSEIVVELKRRFWSDEKIGKELGMEPDEVLRLTQITGLTDMFADAEFSEAWEAESFADLDKEPVVEEIKE